MRGGRGSLRFGSAVVELLIPHRRPFLMIDFVDHFEFAPTPRLHAGRHISMSEPVFEGHFPGLPIWPGAFTMEGLGQAAVLLHVLHRLCRDAEARGEDPAAALQSLENLDRGYRMHPGYNPEEPSLPGSRLPGRGSFLALGASVDIKFLKPVFPGCRLDYMVELAEDFGSRVRFLGEATVDGEPVARGAITAAVVAAQLPPRLG